MQCGTCCGPSPQTPTNPIPRSRPCALCPAPTRWTEDLKRSIKSSRVNATTTVVVRPTRRGRKRRELRGVVVGR